LWNKFFGRLVVGQTTLHKSPKEALMSTLLGAVTLASTVCGLMLGQISAGAQFAGVVLASLVLMTLRA
jgi:hypothetical protein